MHLDIAAFTMGHNSSEGGSSNSSKPNPKGGQLEYQVSFRLVVLRTHLSLHFMMQENDKMRKRRCVCVCVCVRSFFCNFLFVGFHFCCRKAEETKVQKTTEKNQPAAKKKKKEKKKKKKKKKKQKMKNAATGVSKPGPQPGTGTGTGAQVQVQVQVGTGGGVCSSRF